MVRAVLRRLHRRHWVTAAIALLPLALTLAYRSHSPGRNPAPFIALIAGLLLAPALVGLGRASLDRR